MTTPTDEQYEARQNFEQRRDTILGVLGVLDVDQAFIEAIMTVPTLGAADIPKGRDVSFEVHVDTIADAVISALDGSGLGDLFKRDADRKADVRTVLAKMLRETSDWLADTERLLADVSVQRNDARLERDSERALRSVAEEHARAASEELAAIEAVVAKRTRDRSDAGFAREVRAIMNGTR